ncbi:hypothetical protein FQZ97_433360 [compost metagenome]
MDQLDLAIGLHRVHEFVGDADRDIEIGEVALVLGVDKAFDIRMVAAQHAHLRAAARAGGFHRRARGIEHLHEGHRPRRARMRRAHQRARRPDRREVIAHAAAAAHGLGRLRHRGVDAGPPVTRFRHRVAHRLHEAVDQRGLDTGAGGGIDAPGRHEAVFLCPQEARAPGLALVLRLGLRQRQRHTLPDVGNAAFFALGVFFDQDFGGDFLRRHGTVNDLVVCVHVCAHHAPRLGESVDPGRASPARRAADSAAACHGQAGAAGTACARSSRRFAACNDPWRARQFDAMPRTRLQCRSDGPPRMVARSTWSGRERSSHSRFPPVPRVRLVHLYPLLLHPSTASPTRPRTTFALACTRRLQRRPCHFSTAWRLACAGHGAPTAHSAPICGSCPA